MTTFPPVLVFQKVCNGRQFGIPPGIHNGSTLLKTTDGGDHWLSVYQPWEIYINKFIFLNTSIGYLAANNYIFKTINGGLSWYTIFSSSDIFYDVKFIDYNTGFAAGKTNYYDNGLIYKTTNGGTNWYQQLYETGKPKYRLFLTDSLNLWCSGRSSIYKTTDGGGIISYINNSENELPQEFSLSQNYPNPFQSYYQN